MIRSHISQTQSPHQGEGFAARMDLEKATDERGVIHDADHEYDPKKIINLIEFDSQQEIDVLSVRRKRQWNMTPAALCYAAECGAIGYIGCLI